MILNNQNQVQNVAPCCTQQIQQAQPNQVATCPMGAQAQCSTVACQPPLSASGVNINIINPSVGPQQGSCMPCSYPAGYYTGTIGPDGKFQTQGQNPQTQNGVNTTNNQGVNGTNQTANPQNDANGTNQTTQNGTQGSDSQNNGGVTPVPVNNQNNSNNTQATDDKSSSNNVKSENDDNEKTEKRKVVELTDEYIKNLENYLMSQDKSIRLNAAKQVYARLEEDDSRADDKALNALINKMLQDPSEEIKIIALSALEDRIATGDDYTVQLLKQMQQSSANNGQDAIDASNVLLSMSAKKVDKMVHVKDKSKSEKSAADVIQGQMSQADYKKKYEELKKQTEQAKQKAKEKEKANSQPANLPQEKKSS